MSTAALSQQRLRNPAMKKVLLGLAALRTVVAVAAIPLAPFLYEEHFVVLVLLRPTKEVFLAGGFLARQGDVSLALLVLAAIPLSIFGVWLFYLLGRSFSKEIHADKMPGFAARILTPERIKTFERSLDKKGPKLIFLGRLAVLSSATVAAAAGAAKLEPKKFFPYDVAGGILSIAYTVAAGWFLGEAYEKAGPWITVAGVVALVGFAFILGRSLQKD
ncbi:MAG: VTT domain-containing protein [Actinobacteria bacterium]|nr:VTT domain-containing protein [Actinomycetota bacterium]